MTRVISDLYRPGRPNTYDVLRAKVDANSSQTIEELSNQPWLAIQEHLHQIGKVNRAGV